jgi:DNA (cytosine-5)-methyltransferase 1
VLSLFPGIGLLDRAFEEEGFCVVRGPDLLWGGDIRRFHPPVGRFDGVIGGPPCQAFSPMRHLLAAVGRGVRHGNLIPEFERVIAETQPEWFVMENVSAAPEAHVDGYHVTSFMLCPTILADGDGFGHEQRRRRRFTAGFTGTRAVDLRRWIPYAALELPEPALAVLGDARAVRGNNDGTPQPWARMKRETVLAGHGPVGRGNGYDFRRPLGEMCRLQGLPETFSDTLPFTADAKRQAIGNGVPLPMGRAVARAVRSAIEGIDA